MAQVVQLRRRDAGHRKRGVTLSLLSLLPIGFLAIFFAWPVVAILELGFGQGAVSGTLAEADTWQLAAFTVGQASASTVLAVLAGMPVAFLLARVRLPGIGMIRTLVLIPFVLPTVVVGIAFKSLWPHGGIATIVLANAFFNVAVIARTVAGLWSHVDRRAADAARSLGASRWRAFRSVTLPALLPAVASAAAVVFLFCATSFGVVLVLGGTQYRTLETEIYLRTVNLLDLSGAAALSLVQLAAVLAAVGLGAIARRRRAAAPRLRAAGGQRHRPYGGQWALTAVGIGVVLLLMVPIVALLHRSVSGADGWTLAGYRALAGHGDGTLTVTGWDAALNSMRTATDATVLAVMIGVVAAVVLVALRRSPGSLPRAMGETMDAALMLPLGVSAVTVGFGYLVTLDVLPGEWRTSPLLVPFAQALVIMPLVVRIVLPVLRSVDPRQRQAAATLGAGPLRVWREVDLAVTARSLLAAVGFGYVVALGEFGATSFLARPDSPTLPVAVQELISKPGALNQQMAYAACALLMVVTVLVVAGIDQLMRAEQNSMGVF